MNDQKWHMKKVKLLLFSRIYLSRPSSHYLPHLYDEDLCPSDDVSLSDVVCARVDLHRGHAVHGAPVDLALDATGARAAQTTNKTLQSC